MRIISGKFKGKLINFIKSGTTRPLKDSVKENIFNIISHSNLFNINIEKSNILDLYSGIGSFGLESISRGADKIIFVERDKNVAKVLADNLSILSKDKDQVIVDDVATFLCKKIDQKFDIFFLDPPFSDKSFLENLELINKKKIFKKNHIAIIHREKNTADNFSKALKPLIIRKYGRSKIIFGKFLG